MVDGATADVAPTAAVKIFSAGTAGCVADLVTFPLDTAKVRLQVGIQSLMSGHHFPKQPPVLLYLNTKHDFNFSLHLYAFHIIYILQGKLCQVSFNFLQTQRNAVQC